MIHRDTIIQQMQAALAPLAYVHALWLEGADANGTLDEYSDIDFNIDIDDAHEAEAIVAVEAALAAISPIDYRYTMAHGHEKLRQRIYHLADTSPYLMIDFVWQLHSRPAAESCFIRGNMVEAAHVLFDKRGVITHRPGDPAEYAQEHADLLAECRYRYSQHVRVIKYIRRNQFPEAFAYYQRYVVEPLVLLLRMMYTPANTDYYLIHISHHIPADALARLTGFLQVCSLAEMEARIVEAGAWFAQLEAAYLAGPSRIDQQP